MKKITKIFNIIFVLLISLMLFGCDTPSDSNGNNNNQNNNNNNIQPVKIAEKLTIITINDFHGALEPDNEGKYGVSKLAYAIKNDFDRAEAAVLISAGDMFQGTALSYYDRGKTVVDVMNQMKFDSMTIGNHEFDWGYDTIYNYIDGDTSNGEANFPFLGCNVYDKATKSIAKGAKAYTIVERGGLKIGILGFMGETLESSISPTFIADYEFVEVMPLVKKYVKELRETHECDIVIAVGHDDEKYNERLANLSGTERVDAIVNSHSHQTYASVIERSDGVMIPYIQAGSAGEKYGYMTLNINTETKEVISGTSQVKINNGSQIEANVELILYKLKLVTDPIFNRVIGQATENVYKNGCADWAANAIYDYYDVDLAVINSGGIRSQGLPLYKNQDITVSNIHTIVPFDNTVKLVTLKGSDVVRIVKMFVSSTNVYYNESTNEIYINGQKLDYNKKYRVAAIDYIFDNAKYPFLYGENITVTNKLFREILVERVEEDGSIIIPFRKTY